jgi:hypothetical protein
MHLEPIKRLRLQKSIVITFVQGMGCAMGSVAISQVEYLKIKIWKSCQISPYIPLWKHLYWFSFEQPNHNFLFTWAHGFYSVAVGARSGRPWAPHSYDWLSRKRVNKLFSNLLKPCIYIWKSFNMMSKQFKKENAWKGALFASWNAHLTFIC